MKVKFQNIIKNVRDKSNSATILIESKSLEGQLDKVENITKKLLDIDDKKSYRNHHDVIGIWPENINRSIRIEQVHEFIRKMQLKPYYSKYKAGIIIAAEKMTTEAQSAVLKTLEEPPKNTFIILTTSNRSKLLDTIISRCKILDFQEEKSKKYDKKSAEDILKANIVKRFERVEEITKNKDKAKMNDEIIELIFQLTNFFRKKLLKNLKNTKEASNIYKSLSLLEITQTAIERNVNTRLALESLMINLPQCK